MFFDGILAFMAVSYLIIAVYNVVVEIRDWDFLSPDSIAMSGFLVAFCLLVLRLLAEIYL